MSRSWENMFLGFLNRADTNHSAKLHKMVRGLEFRFRKWKDCIIYVAKTKVLVSCAFVFAYAKKRSHDEAQMILTALKLSIKSK